MSFARVYKLMSILTFSMAGEPHGKGRPRATAKGSFARVYTDAKTRKYEKAVQQNARLAMGARAPFTGALSVSLRFRFEPPKSTPKYVRKAMIAGERPYFGAFDADNLAKSILDGMNEIVYGDDKRIVRLWVTKIAHERSGVDVRVEALEPQEEKPA